VSGLSDSTIVAEHQPDVAPISDAEWAMRRDLAACYRLIAMHGWDDLIANHITARVPGEDGAFLINPFGLLFEEVTASNLVKIGSDGELLSPSPHGVNRTGFVIHGAIHEARPDANCVIHLHTPDGVAVSMTETSLLPLNQTAMAIHQDIALHDYEGVALDMAERERLASDLGAKHLMLLRNHGTLALGATVGEAFSRTYFLEWACTVQVKALSTGQPIHHAAPNVITSVEDYMTTESMAQYAALAWPALLRKLEREQPDYAD